MNIADEEGDDDVYKFSKNIVTQVIDNALSNVEVEFVVIVYCSCTLFRLCSANII